MNKINFHIVCFSQKITPKTLRFKITTLVYFNEDHMYESEKYGYRVSHNICQRILKCIKF